MSKITIACTNVKCKVYGASITIEKDLEKGFDYRRIRIEGMEEL